MNAVPEPCQNYCGGFAQPGRNCYQFGTAFSTFGQPFRSGLPALFTAGEAALIIIRQIIAACGSLKKLGVADHSANLLFETSLCNPSRIFRELRTWSKIVVSRFNHRRGADASKSSLCCSDSRSPEEPALTHSIRLKPMEFFQVFKKFNSRGCKKHSVCCCIWLQARNSFESF